MVCVCVFVYMSVCMHFLNIVIVLPCFSPCCFSPELVTSEFKLNVELYVSQPVENNSSKSPTTPVKMFKKFKKVSSF